MKNKYVKITGAQYVYTGYHYSKINELTKYRKMLINERAGDFVSTQKIYKIVNKGVHTLALRIVLYGVEDLETHDQFVFDKDGLEFINEVESDEEVIVYGKLQEL